MAYFTYQSKKIFYRETGNGEPLMVLHGNTASSVMFEMLLPLYQDSFKVILMDFLGNGKSDRVDEFPADIWMNQAKQVIALIEHLNCQKVNLIGTSGGAWTAVNAAMERPDLIKSVAADSFDGRTFANDFAEKLIAERTFAKNDVSARQFYGWCQGDDWEKVVDLDTKALTECAERKLPLFQKSLDHLEVPVLFLGSLEDPMVRSNLAEEYEQIKQQVQNGHVYLFPTGGHPAIVSNTEAAARIITEFINSIKQTN